MSDDFSPQRRTLRQLRQHFEAEHDSANSAIEDDDLRAVDAALLRGRRYVDELRRRIVLHGKSPSAQR